MEENLMVRLGCLRDAVATVDIEQRGGFFKKKDNTEDIPTRINLYYQKYLELIQEGRPKPEGFQTLQKTSEKPKDAQTPPVPRDTTPAKKIITVLHPNDPISEKQIELIEDIIKRYDVDELSSDWRESMNKGEASDFISKFYTKK